MANINLLVLFVISHGLTVRIELYFTSEACSAQSVMCNLREIFVNSKWLNTDDGGIACQNVVSQSKLTELQPDTILSAVLL
jgi:hypothetical protein